MQMEMGAPIQAPASTTAKKLATFRLQCRVKPLTGALRILGGALSASKRLKTVLLTSPRTTRRLTPGVNSEAHHQPTFVLGQRCDNGFLRGFEEKGRAGGISGVGPTRRR